jgi:hypothetical protein
MYYVCGYHCAVDVYRDYLNFQVAWIIFGNQRPDMPDICTGQLPECHDVRSPESHTAAHTPYPFGGQGAGVLSEHDTIEGAEAKLLTLDMSIPPPPTKWNWRNPARNKR